jgi:transcriptional regulator with XRE-family HTH domain
MKEFGERLKELRIKRNMTQDELGLIFETPKSQSTIGTWERGNRECSMSDLVKLAKFFRTSTDYLLGVTDEVTTINTYKEENPKELKDFLNKNKVLFNGAELNEEEKQRMIDILTGLFWDNFTKRP